MRPESLPEGPPIEGAVDLDPAPNHARRSFFTRASRRAPIRRLDILLKEWLAPRANGCVLDS